jgi:capsular polysaccharide biosynthesis protein
VGSIGQPDGTKGGADDRESDERVTAPAGAADQTASGLRFLSGVIRRRWIILVVGLVAGLLTGMLAAFSAPDRFAAETTFVIENPAAGGGPTEVKAATDQVAELMPTIAQLAKSDDVLNKVRSDAGLSESLSTLRARVSSSVPFQTLSVVVRIELDKAAQTDAAMKSFKTQFAQRISRVWGTGTFVALPVQESAAGKLGRSLALVILISGLIGLALAMAGAFIIDNA